MTSLRNESRTEFPAAVKKARFRHCCKDGIPHCENCGQPIRAGHMVYEHLHADGLGGEPTFENCRIYCDVCATKKTVEHDTPIMRKADRQLKSAFGLRPNKRKLRSQGFQKAEPQRSATRPVERSR